MEAEIEKLHTEQQLDKTSTAVSLQAAPVSPQGDTHGSSND
jgi:hypothetical protein